MKAVQQALKVAIVKLHGMNFVGVRLQEVREAFVHTARLTREHDDGAKVEIAYARSAILINEA